MYNANIELKDYNPKQEVYMAEARRKTTKEEREEIVEYCLNNNRDYKIQQLSLMFPIVRYTTG